MQKSILTILFLFLLCSASWAFTSYDNSPLNYDNSPMNYDNSPMNYKNSPMNYKNSPMNMNSKRIIRDERGNAKGYAVPKQNGGVNIFDLDGNREYYLPGD